MRHNFSVGDVVKLDEPGPEFVVDSINEDGSYAWLKVKDAPKKVGQTSVYSPVSGLTLVRTGGSIGETPIPSKIET